MLAGATIMKRKNRHSNHFCLPEEVTGITRRQLLNFGVSIAGYASLGRLLIPSTNAIAQSSYPVQRKLIWINMSGGWDILEVTDPKESSTSGIDMLYSWGEAQTLAGTNIKMGRWLPNIASLGEDVLLLRGLAMGTTSHSAGSIYMDTGVLSNSGNVNAASIPSIVASQGTSTIPIIQLNGGSEPKTDRGLLNPVSVVRANNLNLYRSMYPEDDTATQRRLAMLNYIKNSVSRLQSEVGINDRLNSMANAEGKIRTQFENFVGQKLAVTNEELAAFTAGAPANLDQNIASSFALALKLASQDICDSINVGVGGFDTHSNQSRSLQTRLESVDFVIKSLVDGLKKSNKLDSTLIVLYSDFGRTPKINNSNGRDHWPVGSAIMIGGGIQGGRAVGGTDNDLRALWIDPNIGNIVSEGTSGAIQLNATHLAGSILELTLGTGYMQYRNSYLTNIAALTKLKSS